MGNKNNVRGKCDERQKAIKSINQSSLNGQMGENENETIYILKKVLPFNRPFKKDKIRVGNRNINMTVRQMRVKSLWVCIN